MASDSQTFRTKGVYHSTCIQRLQTVNITSMLQRILSPCGVCYVARCTTGAWALPSATRKGDKRSSRHHARTKLIATARFRWRLWQKDADACYMGSVASSATRRAATHRTITVPSITGTGNGTLDTDHAACTCIHMWGHTYPVLRLRKKRRCCGWKRSGR